MELKVMVALAIVTAAAAASAGESAKKPVKNQLSATHKRMFCGEASDELSSEYARAVAGEVGRRIKAGAKDAGEALSSMRYIYCGPKQVVLEVLE